MNLPIELTDEEARVFSRALAGTQVKGTGARELFRYMKGVFNSEKGGTYHTEKWACALLIDIMASANLNVEMSAVMSKVERAFWKATIGDEESG